MRIIIIEDEEPAIRRLVRFIHNFNAEYQVIAQLESVRQAIGWFESNLNPDLVFLDIHLSDGNSFEILRTAGISCPVIFTTSHPEYIVHAFEAFAIDYLFKPIKREAFNTAMKRLLQRRPSIIRDQRLVPKLQVVNNLDQSDEVSSRIMIKIGHQLKVLDLNEAACFLHENRLTMYVSSDDRRYPLDYSLDQLIRMVDNASFYRINRQCIVSFRHIDKILTYSKSRIRVTLSNKSQQSYDVSADRTADFKTWLINTPQ